MLPPRHSPAKRFRESAAMVAPPAPVALSFSSHVLPPVSVVWWRAQSRPRTDVPRPTPSADAGGGVRVRQYATWRAAPVHTRRRSARPFVERAWPAAVSRPAYRRVPVRNPIRFRTMVAARPPSAAHDRRAGLRPGVGVENRPWAAAAGDCRRPRRPGGDRSGAQRGCVPPGVARVSFAPSLYCPSPRPPPVVSSFPRRFREARWIGGRGRVGCERRTRRTHTIAGRNGGRALLHGYRYQ